MQNFAWRHFFHVDGISIVFSQEIDAKTGEENLNRFNYKSYVKKFKKLYKSSLELHEGFIKVHKGLYESFRNA